MIRYIINTTVAKRDVSGNCYNYSIVTSTKTGERLAINSGWGSDGGNVKALLRKAGLDWNEIHYSERVVAIREFNRLKKHIPAFVYEHETTTDMILDLERKAARKGA